MASSSGSASRGALALLRPSARFVVLLPPVLLLLLGFGGFSVASPNPGHNHGHGSGRRLICWQAILNCQSEADCHYAYEQYLRACEQVLTGQRKKCPSHCISSLVQLNMTKSGPALEDCSCAQDRICIDTKRAIEPCLPRTSSMGCTEARRQCERDFQCRTAMSDYLLHCGKLFSGATCTSACRNVIAYMRKLPKAQLLDTCVCDGSERTICEFVKISMKNLCFDSPPVDEEGSGPEDYDEDDEDYTAESVSETGAAPPTLARHALPLLASILVALLPLI